MNTNSTIIDTLKTSPTFQEYERAYTETVSLPIALRPVQTWQLPLHGRRKETPFCALVASKSRTCAACLQMQEKLCRHASQKPASVTCAYGLCEAAVPLRLCNETIGFLQTGQVLRQKPTAKQTERALDHLEKQGVAIDRNAARKAYMQTPVVSQKRLAAAIHMLSIFAEHLSMKSNQIAVRQANAEPPPIVKAKQYIQEHHSEEISLGSVAKAVHMSAFYFCKVFKRATGVTFTEYVSRTRTEKAKNLLLNPNLRISEIAYEVGFQSLTHFNRVFRRVMRQSPTDYRAQLPSC